MSSADRPIPPPAPLTALLAWLVPGAGYWLLGERVRAFLIFICVISVFGGGVLIGGIRVIDAPTTLAVNPLLQKPWFIGQVLTGPISVVAAVLADHVDPERVAHSRSWEIGTLYTAVAGMLNLLALIDATHRSVIATAPSQGGKEGNPA